MTGNDITYMGAWRLGVSTPRGNALSLQYSLRA